MKQYVCVKQHNFDSCVTVSVRTTQARFVACCFVICFSTILLTKVAGKLYNNAVKNSVTNLFGGSLFRAILDGKISKRCDVCALASSLYNIVNHLFTGTTDDVL